MSEFDPVGKKRVEERYMMEVVEYWPEARSGCNEPGEAAIIKVDGEETSQLVQVFWMVKFREFGLEGKMWVSEAWAHNATKIDGEYRPDRDSRIFQYSKKEPLRLDQIMDDIERQIDWVIGAQT